jgi:hypothetical protein
MVIDGNSNNHGKDLIIGGVTTIRGVTYWIMYYYQLIIVKIKQTRIMDSQVKSYCCIRINS